MRIGVLSDAHGNTLAFEHCINELLKRGVDKLYFLGDAVGYWPDGLGVLGLLEKYSIECLKGNHEAMLIGDLPLDENKDAIYLLERTKKSIKRETLRRIEDWPKLIEENFCGKRVLLVHGSPSDNLEGYIYPWSDLSEWKDLPYDVIINGHTHRPFILTESNIKFINCGSSGMPRDIGNSFSCALIDFSTDQATIIRSSLDRKRIVSKYPDVHKLVVDCLNRL